MKRKSIYIITIILIIIAFLGGFFIGTKKSKNNDISNNISYSEKEYAQITIMILDNNENNQYYKDMSKTFYEFLNSSNISNNIYTKYGVEIKDNLTIKPINEYNAIYSLKIKCDEKEDKSKYINIVNELTNELKNNISGTYNISIKIVDPVTIVKE